MGLTNCKWFGNDIDCDDSLSYLSTSDGWCRTFNMLSYDDVYEDPEFVPTYKIAYRYIILLFLI